MNATPLSGFTKYFLTGPRSAVSKVSDRRYVSVCRSRGHEFDTGWVSFVKTDHEIISMTILLPSTDSRRVFVSYKRKYVH